MALPDPSRGQARTLSSIAELVATGHQLVEGRRYTEACESFRQASQKAVTLMP